MDLNMLEKERIRCIQFYIVPVNSCSLFVLIVFKGAMEPSLV